jgi:translation initiation factor 2 subunit 3
MKNFKDLKELFKNTVAENSPIIPVSAQQGINIEKIYEEICKIKIPKRETDKDPIFLVARSFDINKPGTNPENLKGAVLGGTLVQGKLKTGDVIEIKPGITLKEANQIHYHTIKTKIRSLFRGSEKLDEITPGGSLSIETELDMALGKTDTLSGCVVSHENKLPQITTSIKLKYKLFPKIASSSGESNISQLKTQETLMLSANTSVTVGIIKTLKGDEAEISLKIPIVPFSHEKVGIARNINNHWRLIGYGEIV